MYYLLSHKESNSMKISDINNLSLEQLQIEFMRLSPTYELAQQIEADELKGEDLVDATFKFFDKNYTALKRRKIAPSNPNRFDLDYLKHLRLELKEVRKVYGEYGDISMPYADWLKGGNKAARLFDAKNTHQTALLGVFKKNVTKIRQRLPRFTDKFLDMEQDMYVVPDSLFLQIPLYAPDSEIFNSIKLLLKEHRDPLLYKQILTPAPLHGQRINSNALHKKLRFMLHKVFAPDEPMWKLALKAKLSKRYEGLEKSYKTHSRSFTEGDIDILNIIASRALANTQYICENAVRGTFPSTQKLITPNYDWMMLQKRVLKAWPDLEA